MKIDNDDRIWIIQSLNSLHRNSTLREEAVHTVHRQTHLQIWIACILLGSGCDQTWRSHCPWQRLLQMPWVLDL